MFKYSVAERKSESSILNKPSINVLLARFVYKAIVFRYKLRHQSFGLMS